MTNTKKPNMLFTSLIVFVLVFMLIERIDLLSMKNVAILLMVLVGLWVEYNRGYAHGKAYYTEENPDLPLKASESWDHMHSLQNVIKEHPFCLLELEHAPCVEHDYPLPSGRIHLLQNCKHYTTLSLLDDGWGYSSDTILSKDVLQSGKYKPMLTSDAIRISHDKFWDFYF